jgi:hypothetical protein
MTTHYPLVRDVPLGERKMVGHSNHCSIHVTWADGEVPQTFCGDNWCAGECGLPALVIPWPPTETSPDRFSKASGSQVACGSLMQAKRVEWRGPRVEVPEAHRENFKKRMWW